MFNPETLKRFPRSGAYRDEWMTKNGFGGPALWLAEWLTERLALKPGMRVLDLGCGRAITSLFLAREFDVRVWATDLWITATENWRRIRDAGCEDHVFPFHADARALPFAGEFFDAVIAVDCFSYFGTDDLYLNYLTSFVKPGGVIGTAGAGLVQEISGPVPEHLRSEWTQDYWCLHSADWWRRHWERTGLVDIEVADPMLDGWRVWVDWQRGVAPDNRGEFEMIEADAGRYLGYVRMVGRRRDDAKLEPYCWPDPLCHSPWLVPDEYERVEMLKDGAGDA